MIEAFRGFGYSPQTAIADLIDNSITAGARNIWLSAYWNGEDSYLSIRDDGTGMSEQRLSEAMRPGSQNPLIDRAPGDLGRFGLGLKTASFSQCRRLTVRSREKGKVAATRRWDLDYVTEINEWRLLTDAAPGSDLYFADFNSQLCGTIVLWEHMDRIVGGENVADEKACRRFNDLIADIEVHLGMVFHRFLRRSRGRISIFVNGTKTLPWDPFLIDHPATQMLGMDTLIFKGNTVTVQPYVLPHHSKMDSRTHKATSGPSGWNAHQGFYVYRNERLIVAGDWLGLPYAKEEHYKLARIQLDIPNSMDQEWQIDVRKSRAWPPPALKDDFKRIAVATREQAMSVYRQRGKILARKASAEHVYLWQRRTKRGKVSYEINREHPLIKAIGDVPAPYRGQLKSLLRLVEETVPIPMIAFDHNQEPEKQASPFEYATSRDIQKVMIDVYDALLRSGINPALARQQLLSMEAFQDFPQLVAGIDGPRGAEGEL